MIRPALYKPVRSYVRREGRITRAQRRALEELWPRYGIEAGEDELDLAALFGRHAPRVLEIGFGGGEALIGLAVEHPDIDYLGVDVHRPGIGRTLLGIEAAGIGNVRLLCADAVRVLEHNLADESLSAVHVFFPDPWPKKRHHKRRLVQPAFIELLARRLRVSGRLHLATDREDYVRHMLAVLDACPALRNCAGRGRFAPDPGTRPETKFERRGLRLGHEVRDLIFERV